MIAELAHELLPYAAVLYGVDGMVRVRRGERALCSAWGGRFRWREPGWHPAGLLPTAEVVLTGEPAAFPGPDHADPPAARRAAETDLAAIRAVRARQVRSASPLAAAGALLLALVFGALPVAVYRDPGVRSAAEIAVGAAAVVWAVIVVVAARALRGGGASRGEVAMALAPALFFPPAAGHVLSFLWRDAYRAWPPLAVAAVLAPGEFRRLARQELRRLDENARGGAPVEAEDSARRRALLGLLSALDVDPDALIAAKASEDVLAAVFCPLCEAEYRSGFSTCADCGVPLRAFVARGPSGSPASR